jgi:hypothetical protein
LKHWFNGYLNKNEIDTISSIVKGVHHSWSKIVRIMNTQKSVTTTVENKKDQMVQIRQCSEPTEKVDEIYRKLKYTSTPFPGKNPCGTRVPFSKIKKQVVS